MQTALVCGVGDSAWIEVQERRPGIKIVAGQWDHGFNLSRSGWLWPYGLRNGDAWPFVPLLLAGRA